MKSGDERPSCRDYFTRRRPSPASDGFPDGAAGAIVAGEEAAREYVPVVDRRTGKLLALETCSSVL
jgi:hypothetical protein